MEQIAPESTCYLLLFRLGSVACPLTLSSLPTLLLSVLVSSSWSLITPSLRVLRRLRAGPLPTLPEVPTTGDNTLILALQALEATDYAHALSFVNEALDQGISWDVGKAEALNLRGTFKYVIQSHDYEWLTFATGAMLTRLTLGSL